MLCLLERLSIKTSKNVTSSLLLIKYTENLRANDDGNELIGDGRCDSSGYSAKYGTYTLSCDIFYYPCKKRQKLYKHEKMGLIETLNSLENSRIIIKVLVTDRIPKFADISKKTNRI